MTEEIFKKKYEESQLEISELKQMVSLFKEQIRLLTHKRFGTSSEQFSGQMSLFDAGELINDTGKEETRIISIKEHGRKRTRLTTDKLPDNLPIEVVMHTLKDSELICPCCSGELHRMGEDSRDELKVIPAKMTILRHVRLVYSCRNCERNAIKTPVVKALIPNPVIKAHLHRRKSSPISRHKSS